MELKVLEWREPPPIQKRGRKELVNESKLSPFLTQLQERRGEWALLSIETDYKSAVKRTAYAKSRCKRSGVDVATSIRKINDDRIEVYIRAV